MGRRRLTEDTAMLGSPEVAAVAGVPLPTLDSWVRRGLIGVSVDADGHGTARSWSLQDAAAAVQVARLRGKGLPMQRLRRAVQALEAEGVPNPLAACRLETDGGRVWRFRGEDAPVELGGKRHGSRTIVSRRVLEDLLRAARRELVPVQVPEEVREKFG